MSFIRFRNNQRFLWIGFMVGIVFVLLLLLFVLIKPLFKQNVQNGESLSASKTEWIEMNDAVKAMLDQADSKSEHTEQIQQTEESTQTGESTLAGGSPQIGESAQNNFEDNNTKKNDENSDLISINKGTQEQLLVLPGIGPSKAQAIVEYRQRFGGFQSLEELMEVKGIGLKTFEKLREHIQL